MLRARSLSKEEIKILKPGPATEPTGVLGQRSVAHTGVKLELTRSQTSEKLKILRLFI